MQEIRGVINYGGDVCVGIAMLPSAIGESANAVMHTASGVLGTALSLVTIGWVDKFNHTAKHGMGFSAQILPRLYYGAIRVLNKDVSHGRLNDETEGHFRSKCDTIFEAAHTYSQGKSLGERVGKVLSPETCTDCCSYVLKAWVAARILYAVAAVAAIICRIADMIIGVLSAALSLLFVGSKPGLNRAAYANLTVFGALEDLSRGIRGVINPQQSHLNIRSNPFGRE